MSERVVHTCQAVPYETSGTQWDAIGGVASVWVMKMSDNSMARVVAKADGSYVLNSTMVPDSKLNLLSDTFVSWTGAKTVSKTYALSFTEAAKCVEFKTKLQQAILDVGGRGAATESGVEEVTASSTIALSSSAPGSLVASVDTESSLDISDLSELEGIDSDDTDSIAPTVTITPVSLSPRLGSSSARSRSPSMATKALHNSAGHLPRAAKLSRNSGRRNSGVKGKTLKRGKEAWRDSVDVSSPRSMSLLQLVEDDLPSEGNLLAKDASQMAARERAIKEIYTTELSYTQALQNVVKVAIPMARNRKVFKEDQFLTVFSNIDELYTVSSAFLVTIHSLITRNWDNEATLIGAVMARSIAKFTPYNAYLAGYDHAVKLLGALSERKKAVATYCKELQEELGGQLLASLLITPVQRIPRYQLLYREIIKHTDESHPDYAALVDALESVKTYATSMNKELKDGEMKRLYATLCKRIPGMDEFKSCTLLWMDKRINLQHNGHTCQVMVVFNDRIVFVEAVEKSLAIAHTVQVHCSWVSKAGPNMLRITTPEEKLHITTEPSQTNSMLSRLESCVAADLAAKDSLVPGAEDTLSERRFAYRFKDGSIYTGIWKDAKPNGKGRLKYPARAQFDGILVQGRRSGTGKLSNPTGDVYEGGWADGVPDGDGVLESLHTVYTGGFKNGKKHGVGECVCSLTGTVMGGTWEDDKLHGEGYLRTPLDGGVYEGGFASDRRHGHGTFTWSGGKYEGMWANDMRSGKSGRCEFWDGDVYEGEWVDDQPSGNGTLTRADGTVYTGEFLEGLPHGMGARTDAHGRHAGLFIRGFPDGPGVYTWNDGAVYDGAWKDGVRTGNGRYTVGGVVYEGGWLNNLRHGRGKVTHNGKVLYDGQWQEDRKTGKGYGIFGTAKYTGDWRNNMREGKGVIEGGTIKYIGDWKQNKPHGSGTLTIQDVYTYEGAWVAGKRHGEGKESFKASADAFEGRFEADMRVVGTVARGTHPPVRVDFSDVRNLEESIETSLPFSQAIQVQLW